MNHSSFRRNQEQKLDPQKLKHAFVLRYKRCSLRRVAWLESIKLLAS